MLLKCCSQYVSKFGKDSSGHRTGKVQFSSQFQRKAMPKNVQTSIHVSTSMLQILQARFQPYMNWELLDIGAEFQRGRGTRDQIVNILCIMEKAREFQKKIYFWFIDHAEDFDRGSQKTVENTREMGIPYLLTCLLRNLYVGQEATVFIELDMKQLMGSKLGKEYNKTVSCHPAYYLLGRVHHAKCQAGWSTSWN